MVEIFNKAREYARQAVGDHDFDVLEDEEGRFSSEGEWRLHKQAIKVLRMAVEQCAKQGRFGVITDQGVQPPAPITVDRVIAQIDALEQKYGAGWEEERDGWLIKDFPSSVELIDTLAFFRRMGVHYTRKDANQIDNAIHLRVSSIDFDTIFNPELDANREEGRGLG